MSDSFSNFIVSNPYQTFSSARSFKAISNGKIYVGKVDTDPSIPQNQIQVYIENENGSVVPIPQPVVINAGGYPVYGGQVVKIVVTEAYSMAVYDSYGAQEFYFGNVARFNPSQLLSLLSADHGSLLIGGVDNIFQTVADLVASSPAVGKSCKTIGYYSAGDGGGAEYIIRSGTAAQDYSDAGSIQIDATKHAWLVQKDSYNFKQFGVKASDQASASSNDVFIALAVTRSRFGFSTIVISDVIYHKKPIVLEYYHRIIGYVLGSDSSFTPRFIKIDNTKSGIADLPYPDSSGSDVYDVDAGIIVKRQNAATQHARGITLKGFILQSINKSIYAIYTPRMADFDLEVGSRGYNCGHYWRDMFLGRVGGKHIGLGDAAVDFALSTAWYGTPTTFGTSGSGNSVTFFGSANSYNRGLVLEGFANAMLEHVTLEQINKGLTSSINPIGVSLSSNSSAYGVVSCESSTTCVVRSNNSISDIKISASYNVTQNNSTDGLVRAGNSARLNLSDCTLTASSASLIVKDDTSSIKIGRLTKLTNISYSLANIYNFFDERISSGYVTGSDSLSYPSGSVVGFSTIIGPANASLPSGIIRFTSPGVMQVVVVASGVTSGSFTFGINSSFDYAVNSGGTTSFMAVVNAGDTLNIKASSSSTLSSNGGIRFYLYPSR